MKKEMHKERNETQTDSKKKQKGKKGQKERKEKYNSEKQTERNA